MNTTQVSKIRLLSNNVTIIKEDPSKWNGTDMGRADVKSLTIHINNTMHKNTQNTVLLHELLHIILDMHSIELKEHQIDTIATGIHSFIVENPELVSKIIEDGKVDN